MSLKHGHARKGMLTTEYMIWSGLRQRVLNADSRSYPRYGGRGIGICKEWDSFETFLADMGPRPSLLHSLDRKDNNGDYEPGNCKWSTKAEQANNRRDNRHIEFGGKKQNISQWAKELGISKYRIYQRLNNGYSPEQCLSVTCLPNGLAKGLPRPWTKLPRKRKSLEATHV